MSKNKMVADSARLQNPTYDAHDRQPVQIWNQNCLLLEAVMQERSVLKKSLRYTKTFISLFFSIKKILLVILRKENNHEEYPLK